MRYITDGLSPVCHPLLNSEWLLIISVSSIRNQAGLIFGVIAILFAKDQ